MSEAADEQESVRVLDEYLAQLHAGKRPDREAILRQHPGLASALACLDALEGLAAAPGEVGAGAAKVGALLQPVGGMESASGPMDSDLSMFGRLPRSFGEYELLGEIGRGGMGVVYKARQRSLDRLVAIKMILASHLASPEHVRRFHTEAKAAARLRHRHIVPIHEVGQLHGQDYFVMEYIDGDSLARRVERSRLEIGEAVRILAAVARAVDHLHAQGIVHRDLKPLNILLDAENEPYVTDFGLAKMFAPDSEMTATGVIAGTPSYMAPEQASGHGGEIGPAADIYSLGAILYELLTGRPPFREENPLDTVMAVLSRDPMLPKQLNPKIPRELELVCLKCLAKSPSDRYASAGALAEDLERFVRGEPLQVRPPSVGQRLWSWARRQPALASRLGALAVFYVAFVSVEGAKNYFAAAGETWMFHINMALLFGVWVMSSVVCQQFLDSRRWSIPARFVWGTLDAVLLLAVLLLANGLASPLMVGYGLLIAGSGLWFRVRFVWLMTVLSLVSYGILMLDFYYSWRSEHLQTLMSVNVNRHVINVLAMIVLGAIVAYIVARVRTLSDFCGRRLP